MPVLTDAVKREIGQHFVFGFHGHEVSNDIETLIRDYHLGSVILMKRNVQEVQQVRRMVRDLQLIAKESGHEKPLLIGIDQENGLVSPFSSPTTGTQFPGAMALAATGSAGLAYEVATATGRELKLVGINWAYSPVADVNSDSRNPVIGVRSFGDDPVEVACYVSAVARGLTSSGIAPSVKHFPGHGDTHVDSHLALPRIAKSREELEKTELVPFKEVVEGTSPVASVMTGHMALPLLTGDDAPASLSTKVTKGLLRGDMGYNGVVVTDCLEMDAVAEPLQGGCGTAEGAVRALEAGADIVMVCHTFNRHIEAVKSVYTAVQVGRLNLDELNESGARVRRMKELFAGNWDDVMWNDGEGTMFEQRWRDLKKVNLALSKKVYEKSCRVIWGSDMLPLKVSEEKELMLFTPEMESLNPAVDDAEGMLRDGSGRLRNTAGASYLSLANKMRERAKTQHIVYSPSSCDTEIISDVVGAVIFVLRNADRSVWQKQHMKKVLGSCRGFPVVIVASCGPYDLVGEDDVQAGTAYVATYEFTTCAFEGLIGVVMGCS